MHEQAKIAEAEYFLVRLQTEPQFLQYNLSAFLTAARSVLQYALEEAKGRPGGQAWYDVQVNANPVTTFLKDNRDVNVHRRPVPTNINVRLGTGELVLVGEGIRVAIRDVGTGEESVAESVPPPSAPATPDTQSQPSTTYTFIGWNGPEDIQTLCRQYLDEIVRIVGDGRAHGFLTP
jgi:hypothetical protein